MSDAWRRLTFLNPYTINGLSADAPQNTYRQNLLEIAEGFSSGCAYMDITTPRSNYLSTCQAPYEAFKMDEVHANTFVNQLLARIIEAYFAFDGYDPYLEFQQRRHTVPAEE